MGKSHGLCTLKAMSPPIPQPKNESFDQKSCPRSTIKVPKSIPVWVKVFGTPQWTFAAGMHNKRWPGCISREIFTGAPPPPLFGLRPKKTVKNSPTFRSHHRHVALWTPTLHTHLNPLQKLSKNHQKSGRIWSNWENFSVISSSLKISFNPKKYPKNSKSWSFWKNTFSPPLPYYSWRSSKQYSPVQVSGNKCWPGNYHPGSVTMRCPTNWLGPQLCPNKDWPSWEKENSVTRVVSLRGIHFFKFQQFWFCVFAQFCIHARIETPKKKKMEVPRFGDFETCTLKPKKKVPLRPPSPLVASCTIFANREKNLQGNHPSDFSFPSPSRKGNTLLIVVVVVVPEITGVLWFPESQGDKFVSSFFLGWGTPRKGRLIIDR